MERNAHLTSSRFILKERELNLGQMVDLMEHSGVEKI